MRTRTIIPILLLACVLGSCTTRSRTVKTLSIYGPGVLQYPVVADLNVQQTKVSGMATGGIKQAAWVKDQAIADAVSKASADVLIEPVYQTTRKGGRLTVEVIGFAGTYTNFRKATNADRELLELGILQTSTTSGTLNGPGTKSVFLQNLMK